jgi:hypothetical protein
VASYLDVDGFKLLSIIPPGLIDEIEADQPGWTLAQLGRWSAWIDSRLSKRYAAPFASPYPDAVTGWLNDLVTYEAYLKRGVDPTDKQVSEILRRRDVAQAEVKEAADAKDGLFELPLRANTTESGISKGTPLGAAQASPYVWTTEQRDTARDEDSQ